MEETKYTLCWDCLGEAATPADLFAFYDRFRTAAEADKRVGFFSADEIKDREGEVVSLRLTVVGTVTAHDFVIEVYENLHGSW